MEDKQSTHLQPPLNLCVPEPSKGFWLMATMRIAIPAWRVPAHPISPNYARARETVGVAVPEGVPARKRAGIGLLHSWRLSVIHVLKCT